jgi:hypothetical protein
MADITVTPAALELVLTQQAITLPGVDHTTAVSALALALTLPAPSIVISFPGISRKPSQVFSDEPSSEAVLGGDMASGYPLLNKVFTFDPRTFSFEMPSVLEADKLIIMAFYEVHKDKTFPWYNAQDHTWHDVVFISRPGCRLDGRGDLWRITLKLRQSSP